MWYTVVIASVNIAAPIAGLLLVGVGRTLVNPAFDVAGWLREADSDGLVLSIGTFMAAAACIPLLRFLAGSREAAPWEFLGIRPSSQRDVLLSCAAVVAFVAIADTFAYLVGRPVVPRFMLDAWVTAIFPALLCLAVVVVAPVVEELIFRGFLFAGLRACGASAAVTVLLVSVLFAAVHAQYDLYDRTYVFLLSLLFIGARLRFDSVLPPIAMHVVVNGIGTIETIVVTGS